MTSAERTSVVEQADEADERYRYARSLTEFKQLTSRPFTWETLLDLPGAQENFWFRDVLLQVRGKRREALIDAAKAYLTDSPPANLLRIQNGAVPVEGFGNLLRYWRHMVTYGDPLSLTRAARRASRLLLWGDPEWLADHLKLLPHPLAQAGVARDVAFHPIRFYTRLASQQDEQLAALGVYTWLSHTTNFTELALKHVRAADPFADSRSVSVAVQRMRQTLSTLLAEVPCFVDSIGGGEPHLRLLVELLVESVALSQTLPALAQALSQASVAALKRTNNPQNVFEILKRDSWKSMLVCADLAAGWPEQADFWNRAFLSDLDITLTAPPRAVAADGSVSGSLKDRPILGCSQEASLFQRTVEVLQDLQESGFDVLEWLRKHLGGFPLLGNSRQADHGAWLDQSPKAALLLLFAIELIARKQLPADCLDAFQSLLAEELRRRLPEWEWEEKLGNRRISSDAMELMVIRHVSLALGADRLIAVQDVASEVWSTVMLQTPETALQAPRQAMEHRLQAELMLMGPELLFEFADRLLHLEWWEELSAVMQRIETTQSADQARSPLMGYPELDRLGLFKAMLTHPKDPKTAIQQLKMAVAEHRQVFREDPQFQIYRRLAGGLISLGGADVRLRREVQRVETLVKNWDGITATAAEDGGQEPRGSG